MNEAICWKAVAERDRRLEGRFVVAVKTTGIYCRPGCPAPIPRRKNVVFYPEAVAAEEAGYRPCLRCRPEASRWAGTWPTVARAVRLIEGRALDDESLEKLANRLGVSERHLRRLFAVHLGVSPRALALKARAGRALTLVEKTDLSMAEVAERAGYASLRRFNDAFRARFGITPSSARKRAKERHAA